MDQKGGRLLCFALLKCSPTSSTPDPWKYRPLEEDAGQGFVVVVVGIGIILFLGKSIGCAGTFS